MILNKYSIDGYHVQDIRYLIFVTTTTLVFFYVAVIVGYTAVLPPPLFQTRLFGGFP